MYDLKKVRFPHDVNLWFLSETVDSGDFNFDNFSEDHIREFLPLMFVEEENEQNDVIEKIHTFGNDDDKFMKKKQGNPNLWDRFLHFAYSVYVTP